MSDGRIERPVSHEAAGPPAPRIYVASLSDYNAGRLHGQWLAADQSPDDLAAAVATMLAASRQPGAEEWAIHDYEGFGALALSEYEPLERVSLIARGIVEHGPAFAAWAARDPSDPGLAEQFEGTFRGQWPSTEAYAEELLDDLGATAALDDLPEWLQPYVRLDSAGFARDLELGGRIWTAEGREGVFIFDATL